jgi:periplasmic protein CpxP/Spy
MRPLTILRRLSIPNRVVTVARGVVLALAMTGPALAQNRGGEQPTARQQLQHIHTPQSIDQELAHLTKDLELTPRQQQQILPLLNEHHDRIQALLDKNPTAARQDLAQQIHAISDDMHREIHALLTDRQQELETAMKQRERNGGENRRPGFPAAASPRPSSAP